MSTTLSRPSAPVRVLVVDDHPVVRRGVAALVNQETDLEIVQEANDANTALAAVGEVNPDLAIVDLSLPDRNGVGLVKALHSDHPDVRILVLSLYDEVIFAERAVRAGADGYIMKDQPPSRLIEAIRTVMSGEVYLSEAVLRRVHRNLKSGQPDQSAQFPIDNLTDREIEIFAFIGRGRSSKQIATMLGLSVKTVQAHRERIKAKLQVQNAPELVKLAVEWTSGRVDTNPDPEPELSAMGPVSA